MQTHRSIVPPARDRPRSRALPWAAAATLAVALLMPLASAQVADGEGCAVTPGGWGAQPSGNNNGQLLHDNFDEVFGAELVVGDLVFEDAQDVTDALPYSTGSGRAFKSHAVALEINIEFGDAGLLDGTISDVVVQDDPTTTDDDPYVGMDAREILALAEQLLIDETDGELQGHALIDIMANFNEEQYGCHDNPPCPLGVTALPQDDGSIVIDWLEVEGAEEYRVYRATGGGDFILLASTENTTHTDTTAAVGVTYSYVVTAFDGVFESEDCQAVVTTAVPFFGGVVGIALALVGAVGAAAWARRR